MSGYTRLLVGVQGSHPALERTRLQLHTFAGERYTISSRKQLSCLQSYAHPHFRKIGVVGRGRGVGIHRRHVTTTSVEERDIGVSTTNNYSFSEIVRALEITAAALEFFTFVLCQKTAATLLGQQYDEEKSADVLERIFTKLGPTFVKLAQTASMRPDLVGESYSKSLSKLQDSVEPFDNTVAYTILEQELGRKIPEVFLELSPDPIASASMGQVYRGTLRKEYGGYSVAVKVRRPGAYQKVCVDLGLLRKSIGIIQNLAGIKRDLRILVDDVGTGLLGECDFRNEVTNSKAFLKAHQSLPFITIPKTLDNLCTERVFVSEWVDGKSPMQLVKEKGTFKNDKDILNLVKMGIQCSLSQLLVTGCMHGDPHSGNLLLTKDGKLCYLDFGLLVSVPPNDRQAMMAALVHLGLGEWKRLVQDLDDLNLLKSTTDQEVLAKDLKKEFSYVLGGGASNSDTPLKQLPLLSLQTTRLNFSTLVGVLFKLAFKYKFLLPSYFPLVVRSVSSLEGVALAVDPNFKLVAAGMPVVLNQLLSDRRPTSQKLLRELLLMPGGAIRADETTRQILQVWLSAAQQAARTEDKYLSEESYQGSERASDKQIPASAAIEMKNLLLNPKNVPLRRTLIMSNPAATVAEMPKETRHQLLSILTEVLSSDSATQLTSGMLKSTPSARAQRKRLWMMFKASIPKVVHSPPKNILELIKFTVSVIFAFIKACYNRLVQYMTSFLFQGRSSSQNNKVDSHSTRSSTP